MRCVRHELICPYSIRLYGIQQQQRKITTKKHIYMAQRHTAQWRRKQKRTLVRTHTLKIDYLICYKTDDTYESIEWPNQFQFLLLLSMVLLVLLPLLLLRAKMKKIIGVAPVFWPRCVLRLSWRHEFRNVAIETIKAIIKADSMGDDANTPEKKPTEMYAKQQPIMPYSMCDEQAS